MSGSAILEVALGLGVVYLILSLICSTAQEIIARWSAMRSNTLHDGIKNLLQDPEVRDVAEKVYKHPLVSSLAKKGNKPSYIPARSFTLALLDVLKDPKAEGGPLSEAQNTVRRLPKGPLRDTLSALIEDSGTKIEGIQKNVESWFDESMKRVSGWYKRKAQLVLGVIAIAVTIGLNVDTIRIADGLWSSPALRAEYAALAEQMASQDSTTVQGARITELRAQLSSLPIGWSDDSSSQIGWSDDSSSQTDSKAFSFPGTIVGWLLTAAAISLGAPFWFDALGKLTNLRSAGGKPRESQ